MKQYDLADRMTVVAHIIELLHKNGSWCGEIHIQKAVYLLQHACHVPLGYEYVLYKHGPYSFDLSGELGSMRGANFVELVFPLRGYGPSVSLTNTGKSVFCRNEHAVEAGINKADLIAAWLGNRDVKSLERIATAYFVHEENPHATIDEKAGRLMQLKPHVNDFDAMSAMRELDSKLATLAA